MRIEVCTLLDDEGFLLDPTTWKPQVSVELARRLDLELDDEHWRVIKGVRNFYERTGVSPTMRHLIRLVRNDIDPELASSIEMSRLFGNRVSRHVAMLSGIPKPSDCI